MDFFTDTIEKLQAGDLQTGVIVLLGLVVMFFLLKTLLDYSKAIIIILAIIVVVAIVVPDFDVIDKAKELSSDTVDLVKDRINEDSIKSVKDNIKNNL